MLVVVRKVDASVSWCVCAREAACCVGLQELPHIVGVSVHVAVRVCGICHTGQCRVVLWVSVWPRSQPNCNLHYLKNYLAD